MSVTEQPVAPTGLLPEALATDTRSVPEQGQIAVVRGSTWAVTDVRAQSLPRSGADDAVAGLQHAVTLQSLEEDRLGEELQVVWELELGRSLRPATGLPSSIDPGRFDEPSRLAAFIDALRWGAITSADSQVVQAPFRSGANVEGISLSRCAARSASPAPTCSWPTTSGSARPSRPAWSPRSSSSATAPALRSSSARPASP